MALFMACKVDPGSGGVGGAGGGGGCLPSPPGMSRGGRNPLLQTLGPQICTICQDLPVFARQGLGHQTIAGEALFVRICWNLLEFAGIYWNLLEFAGIYWNLLEFTGICWNLLEFAGICWH